MCTYLGQVGHPMLMVEKVRPMHPPARNGPRYNWSQSQVRVYRPYPDRNRHSRIHHVEKQGEGVGFGVLLINYSNHTQLRQMDKGMVLVHLPEIPRRRVSESLGR